MIETVSESQKCNQATWIRLNRLFTQRDKPVVAWISSNSQLLLQQNYQNFCQQYANKYSHLLVNANALDGGSVFQELQKRLSQQIATNVMFHIQHLADSPEQLVFEVNFEREQLFRNLQASIIFWSDEYSEILWQRWAPDFWDWLVYRFHFEAELPTQADVAIHEHPLPSRGETWESRAERLRERLSKLLAQKDLGTRQRREYASTALALADTLRFLGQFSVARGLYEEAINHFKQENDNLGRANALLGLANLESRLGNLETARSLNAVKLSDESCQRPDGIG